MSWTVFSILSTFCLCVIDLIRRSILIIFNVLGHSHNWYFEVFVLCSSYLALALPPYCSWVTGFSWRYSVFSVNIVFFNGCLGIWSKNNWDDSKCWCLVLSLLSGCSTPLFRLPALILRKCVWKLPGNGCFFRSVSGREDLAERKCREGLWESKGDPVHPKMQGS